ncbi:ABC transporter permease [Schaalia sp. 19OD2882]|uniref:ABC transporter permease n=1 Tax=Schaalia sp. 19OD2882 TaxID=2794089 RepID=UPI001C1F082E|nr:ABC transporter permease [Schaalia sp. 19OD2882]QWW20039.1 ABC transporter permease [Schaalia sp. 19OD2882]
MTTCKTALKIAAAHWRYGLVYLVALSMFGVLSGLANANTDDPTQLKEHHTVVSVIDRDESTISKALRAHVENSGEVAPLQDDRVAMQDAVAKARTEFILVIPKGFGDSLQNAATTGAAKPTLQTIVSPDSAYGRLEELTVNTWVEHAKDNLRVGASAQAAADAADQSTSATSKAVLIASRAGALPDSFVVMAKMSTYPLLAFSVVMIATMMASLSRRATRSRLLASPQTARGRSVGLLAACLVVGLVGWTWIVGLSTILFASGHVSAANVALLGIVALSLGAYTLVGVSIGFLLGQLGTSVEAANAVANIGGMLLAFLSGAWVPADLLPAPVITASKLTPAFWATSAIQGAQDAIDASTRVLAPLLVDCGITALFAVAIAVVGMALGRSRGRASL